MTSFEQYNCVMENWHGWLNSERNNIRRGWFQMLPLYDVKFQYIFRLILTVCVLFYWAFSLFLYLYSVQFSRSVMFNFSWPQESQHARPPCPSPTPGVITFYFLAALGLQCCMKVFSHCSELGYSLVVMWGLLIAVASFVVEQRLSSCGSWAPEHGLSYSSCWIFLDQRLNSCLPHWWVDS